MTTPLPLAYDHLPPGSNLTREFRGDSVTITASAGDATPAVRGAISRRTALSGALLAGGILATGTAIVAAGVDLRRIDLTLRFWAAAIFVVFCAGVFLLVWRVRYDAAVEAVATARRQATVMHVSPAVLIAETSGPLGEHSREIAGSDVRRISVGSDRKDHAGGRQGPPVECVVLEMGSGERLTLLQGHDPAELRWVAATLAQKLGAPFK